MEIEKNLTAVKEALEQAAAAGGHTPPKLIAVSKGQGVEKILPALEAGHRVFGENRVQEAEAKWPALKKEFPDIKLHLIGPLQTNKAKVAVPLFDAIQTVDRPKVARAIKKEIKKTGQAPKLFLQVNTGEEPQKAGVAPAGIGELLAECRTLGLDIAGLMCIPPFDEEPAMHFALLKKLAAEHGLPETSMGMSGDYQTAAALGADYVRVGTAVFGPRG